MQESKTTTREKIAVQIHYPQCWDTAAYPTLEDAIYEILDQGCSECQNKQ